MPALCRWRRSLCVLCRQRPAVNQDCLMERRAVVVRGIVQGVGFRPFVHGLASRLGLAGVVKKQSGLVRIAGGGEALPLDRFLTALTQEAPPLAQIEQVSWEREPVR